MESYMTGPEILKRVQSRGMDHAAWHQVFDTRVSKMGASFELGKTLVENSSENLVWDAIELAECRR